MSQTAFVNSKIKEILGAGVVDCEKLLLDIDHYIKTGYTGKNPQAFHQTFYRIRAGVKSKNEELVKDFIFPPERVRQQRELTEKRLQERAEDEIRVTWNQANRYVGEAEKQLHRAIADPAVNTNRTIAAIQLLTGRRLNEVIEVSTPVAEDEYRIAVDKLEKADDKEKIFPTLVNAELVVEAWLKARPFMKAYVNRSAWVAAGSIELFGNVHKFVHGFTRGLYAHLVYNRRETLQFRQNGTSNLVTQKALCHVTMGSAQWYQRIKME